MLSLILAVLGLIDAIAVVYLGVIITSPTWALVDFVMFCINISLATFNFAAYYRAANP